MFADLSDSNHPSPLTKPAFIAILIPSSFFSFLDTTEEPLMSNDDSATEELDMVSLAKKMFFAWYPTVKIREGRALPFVLPKKMTKADALVFLQYLRENEWTVEAVDSENGPVILVWNTPEVEMTKDVSPKIFWGVVVVGILALAGLAAFMLSTPIPGP